MSSIPDSDTDSVFGLGPDLSSLAGKERVVTDSKENSLDPFVSSYKMHD